MTTKGWHQRKHKRISIGGKKFIAGKLKNINLRDIKKMSDKELEKAKEIAYKKSENSAYEKTVDKLRSEESRRESVKYDAETKDWKALMKSKGIKPAPISKYTKDIKSAIGHGYDEISDLLQLRDSYEHVKDRIEGMASCEGDSISEMKMANLYCSAVYDMINLAQRSKIITKEQADELESAAMDLRTYDE